MNEKKLRERLERFASKPDEALESAEVAAAVLGISQRNLRYHPDAKRVYVTPCRYNYSVGNIREIAKNGFRPTGDWKRLGHAACDVMESCGADVRDHQIRMQAELNKRKE